MKQNPISQLHNNLNDNNQTIQSIHSSQNIQKFDDTLLNSEHIIDTTKNIDTIDQTILQIPTIIPTIPFTNDDTIPSYQPLNMNEYTNNNTIQSNIQQNIPNTIYNNDHTTLQPIIKHIPTTNTTQLLQYQNNSLQQLQAELATSQATVEALQSHLKNISLKDSTTNNDDNTTIDSILQSPIEPINPYGEFTHYDDVDITSVDVWNDLDQSHNTYYIDSNDKNEVYKYANTINDEPDYDRGCTLMQKGIEYYNDGNINEAIRCFEYVTKDQTDNAEAWRWLGQCWAQHEEDKLAIAALQQCITIDPYNINALLMLGVSYTNNLNNQQAITYLRTWIENNPQYIDIIASQDDNNITNNENINIQEYVINLYQSAVKLYPQDYNLWTALGILYHISGEYTQAIESFQEAIKLHNNDPELWNKLGATLSNAGKSAEGVEA